MKRDKEPKASDNWRVQYAPQIAAYKKRFGQEPTFGTIVAREARKECSKHTGEEREALIAYGLSIIYGSAAEHQRKRAESLSHARPAGCR